MAFSEDLTKGEILSGNLLTGLVIGGAALVLAPFAVPLSRPVAKAAYNQATSGMTELAAEAHRELSATNGDAVADTHGV
jgi:hypothetical protein